jgi:hypothetical protein
LIWLQDHPKWQADAWMPADEMADTDARTWRVRNCPYLGDDKIELSQGMLDANHELLSIFWFCREHQRLWYAGPSLTLEASRVMLEVRRR